MKFKALDHYFTGVAVPVSALRSRQSCGIGEFEDLELLGEWGRSVGLEVIQILPVNDTGFQSSPYSALSAFALHPVYLRIQSLPEFRLDQAFESELARIRQRFESQSKIEFNELLKSKLALLERIYTAAGTKLQADRSLGHWIEENPWIKPYAVYNLLKQKHDSRHWESWGEWQNPGHQAIEDFWQECPGDCYFYAWLQHRLEEQFIAVRGRLEAMGMLLKGDIPILMNEDSVDLWYHREFFDITKHAGAPPDMFSETGQNWGFPVYDWPKLEAADYSWWRARLKQADKFYHAYRIDHVLGFFRIWQIPSADNTGTLGYFNPAKYLSSKELKNIGFDKGRVRWLSLPHIHGWDIHFENLEDVQRLKSQYLVQIGNEDLYNLHPSLEGEKTIHALPESQPLKDFLLAWYRNRTLIEVKNDSYHRLWNYPDTKGFKTLNFDEKQRLDQLFRENEEKSEKIWAKQGAKLLSMMQETTAMLMCAEDLGVVPACVPRVLKKLNILSLKIERWTREYTVPGHPYIEVGKYPRLSVCIPSVHDTTTLRGWWEEDLADYQRKEYFELLKLEGDCPETYTHELAREIIRHNLAANSILVIFQLQDLIYLNPALNRELFAEDRVNVPGIIGNGNWAYRMPLELEDLTTAGEFNQQLHKLVVERRERKLKK